MNILGIETSRQQTHVAVRIGTDIYEKKGQSDRFNSVSLILDCKEVVERGNIEMDDLDRVAVSLGPGSFTGIRIGYTAARTLAWTLEIPFGGVSTFRALAASVILEYGSEIRDICIIANARMQELFAGRYRISEQGKIEDEELFLTDIESLQSIFSEKKAIIAGPGVTVSKEQLTDLKEHVSIIEGVDVPEAQFVISETVKTDAFKSALETDCKPIYLKPSEPERNRE